MTTYEERRERRRRFLRRNLVWIVPLGALAAASMFVGVGFLVTWLWRVTVGDIFGFKAISFWQAWGLILLSQILFKANMQRRMPVGPMYRRAYERAAERGAGAEGPEAGGR